MPKKSEGSTFRYCIYEVTKGTSHVLVSVNFKFYPRGCEITI